MAASYIARIEGGPNRVNHAAVAFRTRIYVIGGYYTGLDFLIREPIDVHIFHISTCRWEEVQCSKKSAPFMRYGHTAVLYGHKIYVWGGRNDERACNQLYSFNCLKEKWSFINTYGCLPEPRDGHTACVINHKMYIFGGFLDEPLNVFATGLHALNLKTMTWETVLTSGPEPACRDFHAAVCVKEMMYVFGGRGTNTPPFHTDDLTYPNTLHVYNAVSSQWNIIPTTEKTPVGRRSLSMFVHGTDIYVFGGFNALEYNHYNDLYRLDTVREEWYQVTPHGESPCPRRRQICLAIGDRVYLYGGTSPAIDDYYLDQDEDVPLQDHSDVFILDLRPTLRTLCIAAIIRYKLDFDCLPAKVRDEVYHLLDPSVVTPTFNFKFWKEIKRQGRMLRSFRAKLL